MIIEISHIDFGKILKIYRQEIGMENIVYRILVQSSINHILYILI